MILPHFQEVFKCRCLTVFCEWQDKRLHKTRHKGHCLIWGWSIPVALGVSGYVCEILRLGGYQHLPALSFSLPLAMCSPCLHPPLVFSSTCAMFLVQQFLSGHISVWGELGSCAHPTLWSVHVDKVSSALARTEGGLHNSKSCSVWDVQVIFAFSMPAKFFWGPGKVNQIYTKTP